ncbi:hypothetical protein BGZ81_005838 [Podila clonocystis]|nr:hypothetical protein BGZ81_005838 [Podila clonocystis]
MPWGTMIDLMNFWTKFYTPFVIIKALSNTLILLTTTLLPRKHPISTMKISAVLVIAAIVAVAQAVPSPSGPLHNIDANAPQAAQYHPDVPMKKRNLINVKANKNRVCIRTKVKAKVKDVNVL